MFSPQLCEIRWKGPTWALIIPPPKKNVIHVISLGLVVVYQTCLYTLFLVSPPANTQSCVSTSSCTNVHWPKWLSPSLIDIVHMSWRCKMGHTALLNHVYFLWGFCLSETGYAFYSSLLSFNGLARHYANSCYQFLVDHIHWAGHGELNFKRTDCIVKSGDVLN